MPGGPKEKAAGLDNDKPHYLGHRQRLKARFLDTGPESLADYELLELLLCQALPRRDVKPLAKVLIERFGSFTEVISAPEAQLREVKGIGDAAVVGLKVAAEAAKRMARGTVLDRPVLSSWDSLVGYCRTAMAYEDKEQLRILFLNRKNILIADEVQQRGTIDHTPLYPREVMKRALELGAAALILVHNHPSGDPKPSKADIAMTQEVRDAGNKLGIVIHDHLIIARGGYSSFREMGLI